MSTFLTSRPIHLSPERSVADERRFPAEKIDLFQDNDWLAFQSRVARVFLVQHPKTGKNIPIDHKLYKITIKYTKYAKYASEIYQHFQFQGPSNSTQVGIFGMKLYVASGNPVSNAQWFTASLSREWKCSRVYFCIVEMRILTKGLFQIGRFKS
jgi:hypothetical protein